jgi:hypothetical protein
MFKVSLAMLVNQGLVGPKSRSKDVDDGYAVNIRQLLDDRFKLWGDWRGKARASKGWGSSSKLVSVGKSADTFSA